MNSKFLAALLCVGLSAVVAVPTFAAVTPADQVTTLGDWVEAVTVQDQDKLYTLVGSNLSNSTQIQFQTASFPGIDIHTVFNNQVPTGTWFLNYNVAIDLTYPGGGIRFDTVSMDSDVPGRAPDVLVTKEVRDASGNLLTTLTSLSGNPSAVFDLNPFNLTALQIHETFAVDTGAGVPGNVPGLLLSVTDTYTEVNPNTVPEPASLAIWALLAATGAATGWRKRRTIVKG